MNLSHYLFGLLCFVAAGLLAAHQGADRYRTGYRVEVLLQRRASLQEARHRLHVALSARKRPDKLMQRAAEMRIPIEEPEIAPHSGGAPAEEQ